MDILVIGSGGREHAIIWKLRQSPGVGDIYCAPGNAGTARIAKNVDISSADTDKLLEFAKEKQIDLTIVGPEEPLVRGIVDSFRENNLNILGPTRETARLEGSKSFAKKFMDRYNIPTAKYHEVKSLQEARQAIENYSPPIVIKADGLAAGKGVFICESREEALVTAKQLLEGGILGKAGNNLVIEEFLEGIETSVLCFIDNNTILPMVSSQDHKRVFDRDQGDMTGGMGTYSPNYIYTEDVAKQVEERILGPTLAGIQDEKMDYRGIIFIGLMITREGPKVLEYNVRFGDPETQVVLARLESDLLEIFNRILDNKLDQAKIVWKENAAVCVILASKGYPGEYKKGLEIKGLDNLAGDLLIFHSGTIELDGKILTNGGRVLGIVGQGKAVEEARDQVYSNIDRIHFEGSFYRKDIGTR